MIVKLKDIKPIKRIIWTKRQLEMVQDVIDNYDANKGLIKISKDFKIVDGNHRHQVLLHHYGGEHEIEVEQKKFNRLFYVIKFWLIFLMSFPFLIIYTLIKNKLGYKE